MAADVGQDAIMAMLATIVKTQEEQAAQKASMNARLDLMSLLLQSKEDRLDTHRMGQDDLTTQMEEQVVLQHDEMLARLTALEDDATTKLAAQAARITVLEKKLTIHSGGDTLSGLLPKLSHLQSLLDGLKITLESLQDFCAQR
ncbi:hypothetical protein E2562_006937 [Oryza meyeriana var. granulata]|uniref:Uncharacterized protein n=1 Tax=Oryza meyeriana var. granulata TaxID=110450 RepID=A0A6G1E8D5_9ORYZ|nr:hypothetical protein E2562_006937 [Oryza meyeriana var. granulata]